MSGIRINARQRKVIKIVLVCTAALLLLSLLVDAWTGSVSERSPSFRESMRKYGSAYAGFSIEDFVSTVLHSPRLYGALLLIGLAVFIHRGPKDEKA